jgi:NitT/TauT family transport system substrate-binding protein
LFILLLLSIIRRFGEQTQKFMSVLIGATVHESIAGTRHFALLACRGPHCALAAFMSWVAIVFVIHVGGLQAAEPIRVGVLQSGTVNWTLNVVQTHGLAQREGVELKLTPLASNNALNVAFQAGAVDIIVSDWVWITRQRAEGRAYTFFPYSLAVGALTVRPDAGVKKITDLRGKRLGVAGGPVDKSWLILRAYTRQHFNEDLNDLVYPNFAAPPLLNELMLRGELPAVLNFWHYSARLEAAGMLPLIRVTDALAALGVEGPAPLVGWVFREDWADSHRRELTGFLRAVFAGMRLLGESNEEWDRLKSLIKVSDESTLHALRDAYRAGIPRRFGAREIKNAELLFAILAREGGEELVGKSRRLSEGTFWSGFQIE